MGRVRTAGDISMRFKTADETVKFEVTEVIPESCAVITARPTLVELAKPLLPAALLMFAVPAASGERAGPAATDTGAA